jgi:hypothetical protein
MVERAMHLVESVRPMAPVRQYVLSLPFELWGILGYRTKLMNRVQVVRRDPVRNQRGRAEVTAPKLTVVPISPVVTYPLHQDGCESCETVTLSGSRSRLCWETNISLMTPGV